MSVAETALGLDFSPMQPDDLDWVAAQDQLLYPFPWSAGNFSDSIAAGYGCWIMREGVQCCGYAILMMVVDEAHILNISVAPTHQRRGLGRRLLSHLQDVARLAGGRRMFLEVRPSNLPALALYQRAGFETIGRRKGYYPAPGGREDGLVMSVLL